MTLVTATFESIDEARHAIDRLERAGIDGAEISLLMSEEARVRALGKRIVPGDATNAGEGLGIGGAVGGVLGGLIVGLVAVGSIVVPGAGLLVAGPLVALLAGAGAGSATGGIVGGLIGLGIPRTEAVEIERDVQRGRLLVTAAVDAEDTETAKRLLRDEGGAQVAVDGVR